MEVHTSYNISFQNRLFGILFFTIDHDIYYFSGDKIIKSQEDTIFEIEVFFHDLVFVFGDKFYQFSW